jgi:hypothetical protein
VSDFSKRLALAYFGLNHDERHICCVSLFVLASAYNNDADRED